MRGRGGKRVQHNFLYIRKEKRMIRERQGTKQQH